MADSDSNTCDLSRSPVFTVSDMDNLRNKEKNEGVPLQTQWTFWVDRYKPFYLFKCNITDI